MTFGVAQVRKETQSGLCRLALSAERMPATLNTPGVSVPSYYRFVLLGFPLARLIADAEETTRDSLSWPVCALQCVGASCRGGGVGIFTLVDPIISIAAKYRVIVPSL